MLQKQISVKVSCKTSRELFKPNGNCLKWVHECLMDVNYIFSDFSTNTASLDITACGIYLLNRRYPRQKYLTAKLNPRAVSVLGKLASKGV
ncbi:uncharacterized protein PHALS_11000 [Plasmopara halstedii]|uniref:Uncharacterized protein n=1 Tax=Plasmopara halstedii TaxID=4781 RepID=A0A0P1AJL4_PLAHL|nr:uncharacterized protein PHALS_11000 [Plasmopara halstedii]CEG40820.1 hypothetical protein PHALS_11000 [Plasmopara halstedii]|eukprot:XP_024577189.1 hypothetical protein PHALS_11000 [Plasmopara halstedii]